MVLREIAGLTDTSAVMIERAYSRYIAANAETAKLSRLLEAEKAAAPGAPHPVWTSA